MTRMLHEFPAYKIMEAEAGKRWKDGDEFAVMFDSSYGPLARFYRFGSAIGYAIQNGNDPLKAYERAVKLGHDTHYAFPLATVIHSGPKDPQKTRIALKHGDVILFQDKLFTLTKVPNNNVNLVPVTHS